MLESQHLMANPPPVIGGFTGNVSFTEDEAAARIAAAATVTDTDSANFSTGILTASLYCFWHSRLQPMSKGTLP